MHTHGCGYQAFFRTRLVQDGQGKDQPPATGRRWPPEVQRHDPQRDSPRGQERSTARTAQDMQRPSLLPFAHGGKKRQVLRPGAPCSFCTDHLPECGRRGDRRQPYRLNLSTTPIDNPDPYLRLVTHSTRKPSCGDKYGSNGVPRSTGGRERRGFRGGHGRRNTADGIVSPVAEARHPRLVETLPGEHRTRYREQRSRSI